MFGFFNKKVNVSGKSYFPITTDIHSHILPGIDDGSPDVETSILLIKGLMELGITRSIATPHIIGDMFRNNPTTISSALNLLQNELDNREIDFKLSAAAEYMLDAYFLELLSNKSELLTVSGNLLLTEFSYSTMPTNPEKMSFAIITEGFSPILAHPERYMYYYNDLDQYFRLTELGFLLQVNLLSLTGYYGPSAAKAARFILKNDLASYVATDLHHQKHLEVLSDSRSREIFSETLSLKEWNHDFAV